MSYISEQASTRYIQFHVWQYYLEMSKTKKYIYTLSFNIIHD